MFLNALLYNDIMGLFSTFFDNEPIVGRSHSMSILFDLEIIDVNQEDAIILFDFSMQGFATFTIALNLEEESAQLICYSDDDSNCVFIDSDIGGLCKELIRNRLYFTLDFFEENFGVFENLFENVEVFEYDTEIVKKDEEKEEYQVKIIPKLTKKEVSVDLGIGGLVSRFIENNIITIWSCIGHGAGDCYISVYCLESDVEKLKNEIKTSCNIEKLNVVQDSSYWLPMDDGRKFYSFSWK